MPFEIKNLKDGTYKVCKVYEPTKCFSKKGMSKKKAVKQMQAIIINEHKQPLLEGGVIDKDTFLRRQSKGIYKGLTYDQFVDLENKDRQRVNTEIQQLNEQNKQYDQFIKENPDYEEVMCSFDENGDANKTRTTKAQCKLNHNKAKRKAYDKSIMGKAVNALTDIADFAVDNLPIIPEPVKDIYKKYGPSTSKFSGNGLCISKSSKVHPMSSRDRNILYSRARLESIARIDDEFPDLDKQRKDELKLPYIHSTVVYPDLVLSEHPNYAEYGYWSKPINYETRFEEFAPNYMKTPIEREKIKELYELSKSMSGGRHNFSDYLSDEYYNHIADLMNQIKGSGKKSSTNKFKKQLESIDMTLDEYLTNAKKIAKLRGYNPDFLTIADDNDHKLDYNGTKFGKVGYGDFIIYLFKANQGLIPFEYALEKMQAYHKRAENIKGDWKKNKESANNLALSIIW